MTEELEKYGPTPGVAEEEPLEVTPQPIIPSILEKFRKKRKLIFVGIIIALVLTLTASGLIYYQRLKTKLPFVQKGPLTAIFSHLIMPAFAEFKIEKLNIIPSLPSYSLSSSEITNLKEIEEDIGVTFTSEQLKALEEQGFFFQPTKAELADPNRVVEPHYRVDDMIDWYRKFGGDASKYYRKPKDTIFVTTDLLLHVYHSFIDKTFQNIEETKFHPILSSLSHALFEQSLQQYSNVENPEDKESFKRLTAFFLIPSVILDSGISKPETFSPEEEEQYFTRDKTADTLEAVNSQLSSYRNRVPDEIYNLASAELELISKAETTVPSPIFGELRSEENLLAIEDYTQYKPRSHYNKNSILRSYFRAMMWYGRQSFDVKSPKLTRDAVYLTWLLNSVEVDGKKAIELWENIYLPTVFFVGQSDDLTFYDYSKLMAEIYGNNVQLNELTNEQKLKDFQEKAKELPGPKILSEIKFGEKVFELTKEELLAETKSFRFMGQRFIPDSYIFARLTQGDEKLDPETGQKLPSTPTALMIMSILGSNTADQLLNTWINENAPRSDKVIAKVKGELSSEFAKFNEADWSQNIYWSWLYAIRSLFEKFGEGYPMFMRAANWAKKGLNAALGSWTELRHDTLLYAKQSYAELGGGGEPSPLPSVPKGYVEPNLIFFERIIALSKMTQEGLKLRELLTPEFEGRLSDFIDSLKFLESIAGKELANQEISEDDYERLRVIGREIAPVLYPLPGQTMREKDARSGIIADVHTDAIESQILYEATGTPMIIYVAVKDKGGTRLTRGTVYSYYEFTGPLGERLTDEDWQARVYEGKGEIPSGPAWVDDLLK